MNKKILLLFIAALLAMPGVIAQTVSLVVTPNPAEPGDVTLQVNMAGFPNASAVTLYIDYDANLLTYTGPNPVIYGGQQILVNYSPVTGLGISWANSAGKNINGTFVELDFSYTGWFDTDLVFVGACEIADVNANLIGGISYVGTTLEADNDTPDGKATIGNVGAVPGTMVDVPLNIEDLGGFGGVVSALELRIGFNVAQLQFNSLVDNTLGLIPSVTNGVLTLSNNFPGALNNFPYSPVVKLRFVYLGGGVADVEFLPGSYFADNNGEYLVTGYENGQVELVEPPVGTLTIGQVISDGAECDFPLWQPPDCAIMPVIEEVPVIASDFAGQLVGAITLKIAYDNDPDKLQFVNVIPGALGGWTFSQEPGLLTFTQSSFTGITIPDGTLFTLRFSYSYVPEPNCCNGGEPGDGLAVVGFVAGTVLQDVDFEFLPVELEDGGVVYTVPIEMFPPQNFTAIPEQFTDQDAINTHFNNWLNEFSYTGGCDPILATEPVDPTPPSICGETVTVTWTVTSTCGDSESVTAFYSIPDVDDIDLTVPVDLTLDPCQPEAVIQSEFETWIAQAVFTGGYGATMTMSPASPVLPDFCGGSEVVITWTVTSDCDTDVVKTATFAIAPAMKGDVNCDDDVNVDDIVLVINRIFFEEPLPCFNAADMDDDGFITTDDLVQIINIVFP